MSQNTARRLWQLDLILGMVAVAILFGAVLLKPSQSKRWAECKAPADQMARNICAEFR